MTFFFSVRVVDQPSETPTATFKEEALNICSQISELTLRCHVMNCETIFCEILVFQDPTKLQLIFKCFPGNGPYQEMWLQSRILAQHV